MTATEVVEALGSVPVPCLKCGRREIDVAFSNMCSFGGCTDCRRGRCHGEYRWSCGCCGDSGAAPGECVRDENSTPPSVCLFCGNSFAGSRWGEE